MNNQVICALYGDSANVEPALLKVWWEKTEAWATWLGVPPNEVSARFAEKPKGMSPGQGYDLSRYRSRMHREIEVGNAVALELTALAPEWKYKALDWQFEAMFGADRSAGLLCAAGISVEVLEGALASSPSVFTDDAMCRCGECFSPRYGFAVMTPQRFMPGGYILGIAAEVPDEIVHDANSWSRFAGKQCAHVIRNVFGYNILNPRHLEIDVGGQRLGDWIEASEGRGRLELQDDGLFLWTFQEGNDQEAFLRWDYPPVVSVRERLKEHKVFPWQHLPGLG